MIPGHVFAAENRESNWNYVEWSCEYFAYLFRIAAQAQGFSVEAAIRRLEGAKCKFCDKRAYLAGGMHGTSTIRSFRCSGCTRGVEYCGVREKTFLKRSSECRAADRGYVQREPQPQRESEDIEDDDDGEYDV